MNASSSLTWLAADQISDASDMALAMSSRLPVKIHDDDCALGAYTAHHAP